MSDPFGRHGVSEMVYTGFGDGIGGVRLGSVDDVAGHGGCEDYGARGGTGDDFSTKLSTPFRVKHSSSSSPRHPENQSYKPGNCSCDEKGAVHVHIKYPPPLLDGVLNCQFRSGDTGKAEQDINASKFDRDLSNTIIYNRLVRHVDFFEYNHWLRLFTFTRLSIMLERSCSLLFIDIEDAEMGDTVFKESSGAD